ncbi:MAG: type II secretion system protein [Thermoanaerobaculia bacterium]
MRRTQKKGFTAIELIVIVTIVGLIFIVLLPFYLDSLEKAKQRKTMANINSIGKAMLSWMTDQAGAAAAGASTTEVMDLDNFEGVTREELDAIMVPVYLANVPKSDGWGSDMDYYMKILDFNDADTIAVRSPGKGGNWDGNTYTMAPFVSTNYKSDIVWADGLFVRWPQNWKDQ